MAIMQDEQPSGPSSDIVCDGDGYLDGIYVRTVDLKDIGLVW